MEAAQSLPNGSSARHMKAEKFHRADLEALSPDVLINETIKATGLDDFGQDDYTDNLTVLCDALKNEAQLNEMGQYCAARDLKNILALRLRLHAWAQESRKLVTPQRATVIAGLPRTGTSILYELLDQDTNLHSPKVWSVERAFKTKSKEDIDKLDELIKGAYKIAPELKQQHKLGAHVGEDCCRFHLLCIASYRFLWMYNIPTYADYILPKCLNSAYQWEQLMLNYLSQDKPMGADWLLKSNGHLTYFEGLHSNFPEMNVIHTYRDPATMIASTASMVSSMRSLYSDSVNRTDVFNQQVDFYAQSVDKFMDYLDKHPGLESQIYNFSFDRFIKAPLDEIRRTYTNFGVDLDDAVEQSMRSYLSDNPRNKHGSHTYTLSEFDSCSDAIHDRFARYIQRFDIELH